MTRSLRFSFATNIFDDITATAEAVADSLLWLEEKQRLPSGCWGTASMLERVVATCHAVMAFQCCGYHYTETPLAQGIKFLTSDAGSRSDWTFWRLGPLLGIDYFQSLIAEDMQDLKHRVEKGAEIHPEQVLSIMLLKAHITRPVLNETEIARFIAITLKEWDETSGWHSRADTTANAISVLEHYDFADKERILTISKDFIKRWARSKRDRVVWGSNVSTAYVLYSIAESSMWDDSQLQQLALRASAGLLLARRGASWEPEEPPYGGKQDITGPEYFTASILRGVCAIETRRELNFPLEVQAAMRQKRDSKLKALEKEILELKHAQTEVIESEVSRKLKERSTTLDVRKLSPLELLTKLSVGSIAFLLGLLIAAGVAGWNLSNWYSHIFGVVHQTAASPLATKAEPTSPVQQKNTEKSPRSKAE